MYVSGLKFLMRATNKNTKLFSSSASRSYDVAKLILIGRLGREAELRTTSNNKEYVTYVHNFVSLFSSV